MKKNWITAPDDFPGAYFVGSTRGGGPMKTSLFAAVALATAMTSALAQQDWIQILSSDERVYEVRAGSFEQNLTERSGEPIVAFVVRVRPKDSVRSVQFQFEKNYVRVSDCRAGYGKLVTTELNGRAKYDNDFVLRGGTVASRIAEALCDLAGANRPADSAPVGPTDIAPAGPVRRF